MNQKLVRENMSTDLITIGWEEPMANAYERMKASKIRHLPVHNNDGEIVGMLSDRDVQRSMISEIDHVSGRVLSDETIRFDEDARVKDYMSWPALSVDRNTELREVAERMVKEKLSALLVRRGDKTVGIVTAEDLLRVLIELLEEPGTPSRWSLDGVLSLAAGQC